MSSAFTPLEALLLFQYLSNYGVSPTVFSKISDLLNSDDQIRRSTSYDPGRLSPDALRDFYLRLLKDEARSEISAADASDATNGDASQPASRKRKAPSPSLPTIQEATKDAHLIPQLIRKLYARYREHAIIEIKEDERRYDGLRRSVNEIKSGAWDDRLHREIERGDWDRVIKRKAPIGEKKVDVPVASAVNGTSKQPVSRPQEEAKKPDIDQRPSAPPSQPTTPAISPHQTRQPYQQPVSQPPTISSRHAPPSQLYPTPQPAPIQQVPHVQPSQHAPPPAISPRPPDAQSTSKSSQSPMLPPPPPPSSHTGQPFPPYPYTNPAHPQQLPPHSPFTPVQGQTPTATYQTYGQHAASFPPYSGSPGGVMLQPFAVAPQTPTGPRQQVQTAPNISTARPSMPQRGSGSQAILTQSSFSLSPFDIAKLLATPSTAKKLASPAVAPSPSKDTQWKSIAGRVTRGPRKSSPERPRSRSVSPISERAASPPPEQETARRSRRGKPLSSVPESMAPSRSARARRARGASTTSSVPGSSVRGRTRSQSVMSHAEDVSMVDTESVTGRRVKHEPSTPMDGSDFVRPTIEGTPGQTARRALQSGTSNKRKRGAREDSEVSDAILAPSRQDKSVVIANRNFNRLSSTIMNDIQSHKHASLFSNPVRDKDAEGYSDIIRRPQDLKTIRTAITAGNRAVNAATASDASNAGTPVQRDTGGGGGIFMLPATEDLLPPKAIVNSGQFEKEVMRMFANAVMFNPGDDGVVRDAREMAEGVEGQIAKFREVERSSIAAAAASFASALPTLSESGTRRASEAVEGDEEESAVGKRRKIG